MRVVIVGAGAVGVLIGVQLEHKKHEVAYLVRKGRRAEMKRLLLVHASSGETRCRERPTVFEEGEAVPPFELALLCVRGDQVEAAAATVAAHLPPTVAIGVAAPAPIARLRAAHPGGPVFAIVPMFWSWPEAPGTWRWMVPPLAKTLVSGEGDAAADAKAKELAEALTAAGLPARTAPSVERSAAGPMATGVALLAGWELAEWDLDRLCRDKPLRKLTASAMAEAARIAGPESGTLGRLLALAPGRALDVVLMAAPRLVPSRMDEMWRVHGPKIRAQTRAMLDELLARDGAATASHLRELREKLPAVC